MTLDVVVGLVNEYCGACHDAPSPSLMPRNSWPGVIQAMVDLSSERRGRDFIPAEVARHIKAYYFGSSPKQLPLLPYGDNTSDSTTFRKTELGKKSALPMVIDIVPVELSEAGGLQLLICDAESNRVLLLTKTGEAWQETVLADIPVPSRTEVVDYDQDGDNDIIVAALGFLPPSDKLYGQVLILRQNESGGFGKEVLLDGVGRVTDARAVDVDNDDDLDLVVAVFGGGTVGELLWLENTGAGGHVKHVLLSVSGALNATPIDLNADGRTDFVSLIAQEHESVVAFVNHGQGKLEPVLLTRSPNPMYGFTGMELADLDSDGDADIILTNGDALDTQPDPKPYHGVQWLENKGDLNSSFTISGASTAQARP